MLKTFINFFTNKKKDNDENVIPYIKFENIHKYIKSSEDDRDEYVEYISNNLLLKVNLIIDYIYKNRYNNFNSLNIYDNYVNDLYIYVKKYNNILFENNDLNEYLKHKWSKYKETYLYTYNIYKNEIDLKQNQILKDNLIKYRSIVTMFDL